MTDTNTGSMGILGVLVVIFVVLKLVGFIAWPWLWVLSALWIGALVFMFFVALLTWLHSS